jgi:membrane fusion protein, copper/silver efflux system
MIMRNLIYIIFCFALFSAVTLLPEKAIAAKTAQKQAGIVYTCPMHPDYVSDKPGSCPICGMDLVKKEISTPASKSSVSAERKIRFYRNPMDPSVTSSVPMKDSMGMDYVLVYEETPTAISASMDFQINPEKQQLIGVRKGMVEKHDLVREVRSVARVVIDQELFDAQKEYLGSDFVLTAYWNPAKQKLLMLGMSEDEINDLRKRRWPDGGLLAYVPAGSKGFFRTAYPDTAWVYASVFEDEMHWIKPGQKVVMTSTAFPGETFSGVVTGVAQTVDVATRTARVRIRLPDKERKFHPEMFLTATISADIGSKLAVPQESVIDSGTRTIVYVIKDGDTFEPREVRLGVRASGYYEVLSGVAEGAEVVVSGNFLVDSESRLKGALGN